jgi:Pro-kumamolisin, activation domain
VIILPFTMLTLSHFHSQQAFAHLGYAVYQNVNKPYLGVRNIVSQKPSLIAAEAILKSKSGSSMSSGNVVITSENVSDFEPSKEMTDKATQYFKRLGFNVSQSGLTLTIFGQPLLFEQTFKTKLTIKKDNTGGVSIYPVKEPSIPTNMSDIVEKIVFPRSPTLSGY